MQNQEIKIFAKGVHNLLDDEVIPQEAASDEKNWYTQDGRLKLIPGKAVVGAEGVQGSVTGEIFGYKTDGSKVHYRKIGTKIQYDNAGTWTDIITGLTLTADYSFMNYSSLAGAFTFAVGIDGIYKMNNANPGNYIALYDASKNFKGKAFIDKGRMILWDRPEDKTGLYGSKIDPQDSSVYTTVSGEVTASSGTLVSAGGTKNIFGVVITVTGSGEVFTDNYLGVLVGSLGHTGTINYITGAYVLTTGGGAGTATYLYENSNVGGVTDFTHSGTRVAGEGFQFPQDEGGDAIKTVLVGQDGGYYSLKSRSAYLLVIGADDLTADNNVYRKEIGVLSYRGGSSTSKGIVFMNTANVSKPELTILQKNPIGDNIEPIILFPQFKFANYTYDDCTIDTFERYILVMCKSAGAVNNDTILLCDPVNKTVDITSYSGRTLARKDSDLYMGSSITQTVYKLYDGFDDDGFAVDNYYISKGETYNTNRLKKYRKIRLKGSISPDQSYGVYIDYDDAGAQLVGTVLGSGSYVDYSSPQTIGSNIVGTAQIGGDATAVAYPYFVEIRLRKVPKFRKRKIKFVALGIGYVDIDSMLDFDIMEFEEKIPSRFRQKQNVSLDGEDTDLPTPQA